MSDPNYLTTEVGEDRVAKALAGLRNDPTRTYTPPVVEATEEEVVKSEPEPTLPPGVTRTRQAPERPRESVVTMGSIAYVDFDVAGKADRVVKSQRPAGLPPRPLDSQDWCSVWDQE